MLTVIVVQLLEPNRILLGLPELLELLRNHALHVLLLTSVPAQLLLLRREISCGPCLFVVAAVSKIGLQLTIPLPVAAMLAVLLSVERIVSGAAGEERKPGREPVGQVVGTVVVTEIVVAVAWSQEEMAGEDSWIDYCQGRVGKATLQVDVGIEIHRREQNTTSGSGHGRRDLGRALTVES